MDKYLKPIKDVLPGEFLYCGTSHGEDVGVEIIEIESDGKGNIRFVYADVETTGLINDIDKSVFMPSDHTATLLKVNNES